MAVKSLAHLALNCRNIEKSVDFYVRVLDLKYLFTQKRDDGSLWYVYLHAGGSTFLELFPTTAAPPVPPHAGIVHLCLAVDDIAASVERVRKEGWPLDSDIKTGRDGNLQVWLRDPDGTPIELMQMMPGSMQERALGNPSIE
jgi:lactoylglutathione lyase